MATASISGLASGLDTSSIISQLMKLEATTQTKLKSRATTEQTAVTALQGINTKLATLATSAKDIASPAPGSTSPWNALSATSSSSAITVTASSSASATGFTVTVEQLAAKARVGFLGSASLSAPGTVPTSLEIERGGVVVPLTTDGTLGGVVSALNDGRTGLRATAVKVGTDSYRLVVESATTGADQGFTLRTTDGTDLLGGEDPALARAGADARISLSGVVVTSSTNTFSGVVAGVDITVGASAVIGQPADITIAKDATSRSASAKSLVDSVNAILTQIGTQTTANTDAAKRGPLAGDSTLTFLTDQLVGTIYPGGTGSMAQYGVQVDRYGKLVFDEKKFAAAYAKDPAAVSAAFAGPTGFASRVQKAAEAASDKYKGYVTSAVNGRNDSIKRLTDSIADWDDRLALREATLQRQYTSLETALSNMQGQSSWLASQIASLPSSGA